MIPERNPPLDLFRRLKPLYGERIDRLWIAYQLGNNDERREIEALLTILAVKRQDMGVGNERIILEPPPPNVIGGGEYTIGTVEYPGSNPYPFTLHRAELLRHLFILGPSGTGKSTLIIGLLRQLLRTGVPFWSIDFKRNYRCLLHDEHGSSVLVFTVGRDTAPLRLNMLTPPPGVVAAEWVSSLGDIISSAYLLMQGARNVLKAALQNAIDEYGAQATLRHARTILASELGRSRSGSRRYGWLESSYRSIDELTNGELGNALNATTPFRLTDLLGLPIVFELQGLGDDQKRCFCLYLLQAVLLLRKHDHHDREVLKHVLVFDEAHNVFPKEQWGELGVPSRLAREVREYGEAIIAATQQADVADSLIANSGIKLILRTDYPKDVEFASKLLQIEQRWLPKIPLGQGIARLPTRYYQPFLFGFPEQPIKNQPTSDGAVQECYTQWEQRRAPTRALAKLGPGVAVVPKENERATAPATRDDRAPGERAIALLIDIARHPISTITERYARLSWNPKMGNHTKDAVLNDGLVDFVILPVNSGRVKLLTLTEQGERVVRNQGVAIARSGPGGMEHEFWRARIKERCTARGCRVTEEYPVGTGRVDLYAERENRRFVIEIETGKSDLRANITKCEGHDATLVVFFTNNTAKTQSADLLAGWPGVIVITPDTINTLHDLLRS